MARNKSLVEHLGEHEEVTKQAKLMLAEALKTFKGGQAKMEQSQIRGIEKSYTPANDDGMRFEPEKRNIKSTVPEKINDVFVAFKTWLDYVASRDLTNTTAFADVEVDGEVILKHVPVDTLIEGQKILAQVRSLFDEIPTLDESHEWRPGEKPGVWVRGPIQTYYRSKITKPLTLAPATKEHKEQVKEITEDVIQGTWSTTYYDGSMTSAMQEILFRECDKLIIAFKAAQRRANMMELSPMSIGEVILGRLRDKMEGKGKK